MDRHQPGTDVPQKLFTLEEANELIPKLRRLMMQIVDDREALAVMQPDVTRARQKAQQGGGTRHGMRYLQRLERFGAAAQTVEALGVIVKDYQIGLCDFPHIKNGRIVYLCWRMDEDKIRFWHDIEAGFAGRQPL
ncbi:MAG: DUF2203 domain-containing protein [Blastocatellia bacterium]|nr:DUF2203 domain-containing protein [Blastocatellia bacterium]